MFIVIGSFLLVPSVTANANQELNQIREERREVQSQLSEVEQEVADLMEEIDQMNDLLKRLEQARKDNEKTIENTLNEIADLENEAAELQLEIEKLEADIEARLGILGQRAASYQKNGGNISYLEVILGSRSFGDFIDRVIAIAKIARADNEFIAQLEISKDELVVKQDALEVKMNALNDKMAELEDMQHHLLDQEEQNNELLKDLKDKEAKAAALMEDLTQHASDLANAENDILRRIEEERRRREAERAASQTSSSNVTTASTSSAPIVNGTAQDVIRVGFKYIGNSVYVFGGGRSQYDINNGRFDCSGFTRWAFAQIGYNIGYSTDAQKFAGRQVPASEMRPGDLVFFDTYKRDGHVAIYMGGGQFIGSQSSTGVAVASMSSGYWAQRFNGRVVRVIN